MLTSNVNSNPMLLDHSHRDKKQSEQIKFYYSCALNVHYAWITIKREILTSHRFVIWKRRFDNATVHISRTSVHTNIITLLDLRDSTRNLFLKY